MQYRAEKVIIGWLSRVKEGELPRITDKYGRTFELGPSWEIEPFLQPPGLRAGMTPVILDMMDDNKLIRGHPDGVREYEKIRDREDAVALNLTSLEATLKQSLLYFEDVLFRLNRELRQIEEEESSLRDMHNAVLEDIDYVRTFRPQNLLRARNLAGRLEVYKTELRSLGDKYTSLLEAFLEVEDIYKHLVAVDTLLPTEEDDHVLDACRKAWKALGYD